MSPPQYMIDAARAEAMRSPCAKSKRGVVLFDRGMIELWESSETPMHRPSSERLIVGRGFNGQPGNFVCTGDLMKCSGACAKLCLHAEQRAINQALVHSGDREDGCSMGDLELVHVKVENDVVVPGGGPSCWQCSRLVVEVGIRGVWLFEAQRWHTEFPCGTCSNITRLEQDAGITGKCPCCVAVGNQPGMLRLERAKTVYDIASGVWRFYNAQAFHAATIQECGLPLAQAWTMKVTP